jgi:hypothetical protein
VRFYTMVGQGLDTASASVTTALRTVLHDSPAAFIAQWRAYLVAQLA